MKLKLRLPDRLLASKIAARPAFQKLQLSSRQGAVSLRRSFELFGKLETRLQPRRKLVRRSTALLLMLLFIVVEFIQLITSLPPNLTMLQQGREAYNIGEYNQALQILRQDLTQHPGDSQTKLLLAESSIALHQWTEAGGYLAELVRQSPNDPALYYWIGRAQLGAGQTDSAETSWNLILNRPDAAAVAEKTQIEFALGQLRFQQGRYSDASTLIYKALNDPAGFDPADRQEAFYLYGLLLARDLRFSDATNALSRAVNLSLPGNELGNVPIQVRFNNTADQARTMLTQLPSAASEKADGAKRAKLAYAYILAGEYAPAQEQLLQVLKVAPTYTDAQAYLGLVYWRTGHITQALNVLNTAVTQQPGNQLARQALAEILIDQMPALQLKPETADQFRQDSDETARLLQSLKVDRPDDANLEVTMARYYIAKHDYDNAQTHYQTALSLNQDKPVAGLNAGAELSLYYSQNNIDPCVRGVDTGLQATKDSPNDADSWYAAGTAYVKCGYPNLAAPELEKALALRPYWLDAMYQLGLCYDGLHRGTEADRLFELLTDLDPDGNYPRLAKLSS